ncbi:hypothetical protein BDAP_002010 [Binucleata daphniae]
MNNKNGFFISCFRNREQQAYNDFIRLVSPLTSIKTDAALDITKSLEEEKSSDKQTLCKIHVKNLKNVVFIENKSKQSSLSLYENIKHMKSKYIQRLIPLYTIFDLVDYKENIQAFVNEYVEENIKKHNNMIQTIIIIDNNADKNNNIPTHATYKLVIEDRLTDKETKKEIFEYTLSLMKCNVNLKEPDFVFVIQICKNIVGLSFMKYDKKNYNINIKQKVEEEKELE